MDERKRYQEAARKAEAEKKAREAAKAAQETEDSGEEMSPQDLKALGAKPSLETGHTVLSPAEQAAHLKQHSRSTVDLHRITAQAPDPAQLAAGKDKDKKKNTYRWQYGIRSRNSPLEALHCIYKALKKLGAEWQVEEPKGKKKEEGPFDVNVAGATHLTSADSTLSESPEKGRIYSKNQAAKEDAAKVFAFSHDGSVASGPVTKNYDDDDVDPDVIPDGYFPEDPWVIHVRWLVENLQPQGITSSGSANSSRLDVSSVPTSATTDGRRASIIGSNMSSAVGSSTSVGAHQLPARLQGDAVYVYMDIQLYTMEVETYLVDFKCAGYERAMYEDAGEGKVRVLGSGNRVQDKEVTSPQPFLDVANKLVIQLAKG